jgi:hypothetical protein
MSRARVTFDVFCRTPVVPYTPFMENGGTGTAVAVALIVALFWAGGPASAQSSTIVKDSAGTPVEWDDWIDSRAPAAVLLISSWAPESGRTLDRLAELERVCASRDLDLVIVVVQETFGDARAALGGVRDVPWLHDRHGALLKRYRVIKVPAVVIVDDEGAAVGRVDASPEAVSAWDPESEDE